MHVLEQLAVMRLPAADLPVIDVPFELVGRLDREWSDTHEEPDPRQCSISPIHWERVNAVRFQ